MSNYDAVLKAFYLQKYKTYFHPSIQNQVLDMCKNPNFVVFPHLSLCIFFSYFSFDAKI